MIFGRLHTAHTAPLACGEWLSIFKLYKAIRLGSGWIKAATKLLKEIREDTGAWIMDASSEYNLNEAVVKTCS
jgi:hypothetical protein